MTACLTKRVGEGGFKRFVVWMMDEFLWHGLSNRVACGGAGCGQRATDQSGMCG